MGRDGLPAGRRQAHLLKGVLKARHNGLGGVSPGYIVKVEEYGFQFHSISPNLLMIRAGFRRPPHPALAGQGPRSFSFIAGPK